MINSNLGHTREIYHAMSMRPREFHDQTSMTIGQMTFHQLTVRQVCGACMRGDGAAAMKPPAHCA